MLPHRSATVELETGQVFQHHPVHRRQTYRTGGRLSALTEAHTQEEAAHDSVRSQSGLEFFQLCRDSRKAAHQHGVTATSSGHVEQEAQYKDKEYLRDACLLQELGIKKNTTIKTKGSRCK